MSALHVGGFKDQEAKPSGTQEQGLILVNELEWL